ncbi:MAG: hypothetical protein Q8R11_03590 [bacterium]|nr:hypothetical protein [bacterium]
MWEKIFRRLHVSKGQLFFLLALWIAWGVVLIFWPAPSSIEVLGIEHTVFFVPLFAAILVTVYLLTHHPRRSILIAVGVVSLAMMQLFRMVTILNTFLLVASVLLVEFAFHQRRRRKSLLRKF